jgi:ribosome maturation factor RimP
MGTTDRVRDLIAPLLDTRDLELVDVELAGAVLRVVVDRPGGVDLDAVADATRVVSAALDGADPLPGRYTLEVSSPGLERPLRRPEHFLAAVGRRVRVKTVPGVEPERRLEGDLVAAEDDGVVLRLDDGHERRLAFPDIERARTVFAWGPAPEPGRGSRPQPVRKARATRS